MAVIREKQQFQNQRIGVVRMDTGAENYYQTVANAADTLTQIAFKEAGRVAQKKGAELAESASTQSLRTINPETGKPEAYNIPENFGTAAQAAYEEVLDRRFISDVDNQIKERARELVLKYQNDPQGVEKYGQAMEDYVAQMINPKNSGALNDRFQNIIRDTGAAFIASTKFNLMTQRAQVVQNQLRDGLIQDAINGGESIEDLIKSGKGSGVEFVGVKEGEREVTTALDLMIQTEIDRQDAGLDAGILTQPQYEANVTALMSAVPTGILNNRLNYDALFVDNNGDEQRMTSDVALEIENALDTGVISKDLPESLVAEVNTILESDGYKRNKAGIQRKAGELRVGLSNREKEVAKETKLETAMKQVADDSYVVDTQDGINQKAVDVLIASVEKLEDPMNANMGAYYSSPESTKIDASWKYFLHTKNLIGEGLNLSLKRLSRLERMSADEMRTVLGHYDYMSNAVVGGSVVDMSYGSKLSKDEHAFLKSLNSITKIAGTENIVELASSLKENMQNTKLVDDRVKTILEAKGTEGAESVLTRYLQEGFGTDRFMVELARPYVKHLIMAGVTKEDLDKAMNEMFESSYVDTNGVVVDRYNPQVAKSMFAMKRILPSDKDRVVFYKNAQDYVNEKSGGNFAIGENLQGVESNRQIKLVPMTNNALQPDVLSIEYTIIDESQVIAGKPKEIKQTTQLETFQYIAHYVDDNGELKPIRDKNTGGPIYVGTELAQDEIAMVRKTEAEDAVRYSNEQVLKQLKINKRIKKNIKALSGSFGGPDKPDKSPKPPKPFVGSKASIPDEMSGDVN